MTIDVRRVREEEFDAWSDAIDIGFNTPQARGDGQRRRRWFELDRCWGAFDGATPVGTLRALSLEATVPGGTFVPLAGLSAVTVASSHRRRGLLSRMMAGELGASKERGDVLAGLYAAEYPIYGRFGFAAATTSANWHLDARAAEFSRELPGVIEIVDTETALKEAAPLYDRVRAITPGAVNRTRAMWERKLDLVPREGEPVPKNFLHALCRDERGEAVGFLRYKFGEERWTHERPDNVVDILDLFAINVEYEARLWKYLADHDWVSEVVGKGGRREDELWRDLLVNRRVAWSDDACDAQWIRVLDTPAALSARRYQVPGRFVLRVVDKDGFADGTFALEGGPDGATCGPTAESPDVTLPVTVLGAIYFGGFTAARFGLLGMLDEHRNGAVARLSAMFQTAIAPWCPASY
ncbi:MAG TPA: GNAT family N-acetyltransferase [Actinocrinis sp.]|uniref:GNAT family N-acetyltransferase n=1 Tax=Actinocrinis sp. TaxID=1920516 RepID=UPI002D3572FC|nr:GNAT family N-acetyltransferase [Actinocrinis sp.]HZU57588.1 GNAT family N-acetyltransferase [Actinocrinis sp.]